MNLFYKMAVDRASSRYLSGWCFHRLHPDRPVELECCLAGKVLTTTTANLFREDLRELNVHPSGRCGFEMVLEQQCYPAGSFLTIRAKGAATALQRIPTDSFDHSRGRNNLLREKFRRLWPAARKGKPILFMHIPKTAGTSFNTFAIAAFPNGQSISHIELINKARYPEFQTKYLYISGHLPIGALKESFRLEGVDLYTIIREPYAQLHSHLKWLIRTAGDQHDNYFRNDNPAILELGASLASIDFQHPQAIESFIAQMGDLEAAFLDNMQLRYFLDTAPRRTATSDLAQATNNCRFFRKIGLTEQYSNFTAGFAQAHSLTRRGKPFQLNRSRSEPLFDTQSPEIRQALKPLVSLDLQLYEHISNLTD